MLDDTLIVFTYAPAGLGHIRVADAFMSGIPKGLRYVVFSPEDTSTETIHRFNSLNVPARYVMEYFQRGRPEAMFTRVYTNYLVKKAGNLTTQFTDLIRSQDKKPSKIIVIATHFGLAYQLCAIQKQLETELGSKTHIVVQVTDDSPQIIWYVDSADLIICPSQKTKQTLLAHAKRKGLEKVDVKVLPYPVSTELAKKLSQEKDDNRADQYDPSKKTPINIMIPVSGAAVGMEFFLHIMQWLHLKSQRFTFHIVCRRAPFTREFLRKVSHRNYVKLHVSHEYKEVIGMYNEVYKENVISAEITKPSEQSFKALLRSDSVGGSYLLFAEPVGRQGYDNVDFMKRHTYLSEKNNHLRGFILPFGSKATAEYIWDLYRSGRLLKNYKAFTQPDNTDETGDNGVTRFWETLCKRYCGEYLPL